MRKLLFPVLLGLFVLSALSSTYKVDKVQWYTWEQAMTLSKKDQKKILVFIHTDRCNWCMKMENQTFNDSYISAYLNENYLPVKFYAQQKDPIVFKDKEYKYVKQGKSGYHELAAALTGGRLVYPTSVFLDKESRVLQSIQGYHESDIFEKILTFYGEDHYMKTPWKKYERNYEQLMKAQPVFVPDDKDDK